MGQDICCEKNAAAKSSKPNEIARRPAAESLPGSIARPSNIQRPKRNDRDAYPENVIQGDRKRDRIVVCFRPKHGQPKVITDVRSDPNGSDLDERPKKKCQLFAAPAKQLVAQPAQP